MGTSVSPCPLADAVRHKHDAVTAFLRAQGGSLGEAVQAHPIKAKLKAPGFKRLKLKYEKPLSNFAFKCNLRRYTWVPTWRQGLTLVHFSPQPEPFLTQNTT